MIIEWIIRLCIAGLLILAAIMGWNWIDKENMGALFIYI